MIEMCELLTSYLFNALWQVSVIWTAAYCMARMLRRFGPAIEYTIWVCSLVSSVAVPALGVCCVHFAGRPIPAPMPSPTPWTPAYILYPQFERNAGGIPAFVCACAIAYAILFSLRSLRFGYHVYLVTALAKGAAAVTLSPEKQAAWHNVLRGMKVKGVRLLASTQVASPVTVSAPEATIVLPADFADEATLDVFTAAVAHECAHIRRRDYRCNLIYELLLIFIAFHPLARTIRRHIARTREMICDGMAVRSIMDWQRYALALLEVAQKLSGSAQNAHTQALGVLSSNDLEERILVLKRGGKVNCSRPSCWMTLLAGSLLAAVSILAGAGTHLLAAQPNAGAADVGSKPLKRNVALLCTYWDSKTRPHDGTCGRIADTKTYVCVFNENPRISQFQSGCESKVLQAERVAGERKAPPVQ